MATSPDDTIRDGQRALQIIKGLIEKNPHDNTYYDTLAACYAEIGEFQKAVASQNRYISGIDKIIENNKLLRANARLEFYKKNKPWRIKFKYME